jgi:hypothetical protein
MVEYKKIMLVVLTYMFVSDPDLYICQWGSFVVAATSRPCGGGHSQDPHDQYVCLFTNEHNLFF